MEYYSERTYKGKTYRYFRAKKQYMVCGEWKPTPKGFLKVTLPADEGKALEMAKRLKAELDAWRDGIGQGMQPAAEGSFVWLIGEYKGSKWFKDLGARTQKEYGYILEAIKERLRAGDIADAPAMEWTRQHARLLYRAFLSRPRKAQLVAAISRIVFNYGIEEVFAEEKLNPFTEMGISKNKPREEIWLDVEQPDNMFWRIIALKQACIDKGVPSMALAIDTALFTIQRQGDIVKLPWGKYDGSEIRLRQGKTAKWVYIPVNRMPVFKAILDTAPRISPTMIISERTSKPYDKDHCGDVFREIRAAAAQPEGLQFRDFRRTGVVLWGMAGAEPQEIAAISGHTIEETINILETYLPRNMRMAEHGADKVNARYGAELKKIQML